MEHAAFCDPGAKLSWGSIEMVPATPLTFLENWGIKVNSATCLGSSEIFQAFLPSTSVPWDEWCLLRIEQWRSTTLKFHFAREARELKSLPMPGACPRMAINGWPPNMGRLPFGQGGTKVHRSRT